MKRLGKEAGLKLNYTALSMKVIDQLYDTISTTKIDELSSEQCASLASTNPDYNILAGRIVVSNHHKNTEPSFSNVMKQLYEYKDKHDLAAPLISTELYELASNHAALFDTWIDHSRDYLIDYFGFKTLERAYLMRINGKIVERPQHMWLRVALGIHNKDLERARETYELMSLKFFTHATPTLFNAGTPRPQLSSCFLLSMQDDSIEGIFDTLKDCAMISKWAGGIGLHIHNIRASGSHIRGTNGASNGIVPMLRVFNNTAKYVDQGGGKRNGSFAIYLEPWHADIEVFLQMRKNHGDEELKARDLFYALWVPDLFMERVKSGGQWTLMCPDECPGLSDAVGDDFVKLYTKYETEGRGRKTLAARDVWFKILDAQMETGTPYLCYKDTSNLKSNQKNLGTIKSSNLCVAPDTLVLTDRGNIPIIDLSGQIVNVWNGHEWSSVKVFQTGTNQPMMRVTVRVSPKETRTLRCTHYHKFFVYNEHGVSTMVDAQSLMLGTTLLDLDFPECSTNWSYHDAVVCGLQMDADRSDTYCFTEPKRHMGVFNGILTGQCTEIMEYSDANETAVCNLASISLPAFVKKDKTFDYDELVRVTRVVTRNLDRIIDVNYYPTAKTRRSNLRHRPIGIGVQGLADTFIMMDLAFISDEAKEVNKLIFESIYYGACVESNIIAEEITAAYKSNSDYPSNEYDTQNPEFAGAYSTFVGSPASQGILQFDMWSVTPSSRYDWTTLKQRIQTGGLRNSLLVAPMPTASTSQILGNNECIEPLTSNIYSRKTLAGSFILANKYLMKELIDLGLWNDTLKNSIIANDGSIQHLDTIPKHIRDKYLTVWEIPMKTCIDMARDRGAFICQSQSLNLWVANPDYNKLTSMHFYAWSQGLKTGVYYLRRKAVHKAQQFTIAPPTNKEVCETCSA
jgi:ribonucleotide reductase alpha subunit